MSDENIELDVTVNDQASIAIDKIAGRVEKLGGKMDSLTDRVAGFVKTYGGIAGALSLGASIHSANQYLGTITRIQENTREGANNIAGMYDAMQRVGLKADQIEGAFSALTDHEKRMRGEMRNWGDETTYFARKIGVDFRKGPVDAMVQLSAGMEKGKVKYGELEKLFGSSGQQMRRFLEQGPKAVQEQLEQARKRMGHINNDTIQQYMKMQAATEKVKAGWQRMVTVVGARLLPVITKAMDYVSNNVDSWADKADRFGKFLSEHLEQAVAIATTLGKVFAANYAMMKLTGTGIVGNLSKATGAAGKMNVGGMASSAAGLVGVGKKGKSGNIVARFMRGLPVLGKIAKTLLKLGAVGVIVGVIVGGIKSALRHSKGIKDQIMDAFNRIWKIIKRIKDQFDKMFGPETPLGKFIRSFGGLILKAFKGVLGIVEKIFHIFSVLLYMFNRATKGDFMGYTAAEEEMMKSERARAQSARYRGVHAAERMLKKAEKIVARGGPNARERELYEKNLAPLLKKYNIEPSAAVRAAYAKPTAEAGPKDRPDIYQDFRWSRFDITQQFAEGYEPDRIIAAFQNDLGTLADQPISSGLGSILGAR